MACDPGASGLRGIVPDEFTNLESSHSPVRNTDVHEDESLGCLTRIDDEGTELKLGKVNTLRLPKQKAQQTRKCVCGCLSGIYLVICAGRKG